jgi:5S rRNA maturation endonuclease (ribonuclease M5)/KaiC/GvpD/RAD55 family RecA-like ATPase
MQIQSYITKQIYNYSPNGERSICPECSIDRTKTTEKCLAWDKERDRGYCHHCTTNFYEYIKPKEYICPAWSNKTDLTDKDVKWFEGRMISQTTLVKMRVYSDSEFMTQFSKKVDVICFPYFSGNKLINIKYRGPEKSFKLVKGAELIFWNIDCLKKHTEVIIVEGEMDALTMIQAGFENTLSVPNGAAKNLDYLNPVMFHQIKKIFIAVDQDEAGIELKNKLIRKLGAERCYIVSFKDCKDANEYLLKYGDAIKDVIKNATSVPLIEEHDFLIGKSANDWMKEASRRPIPKMLFSELWHETEFCIFFSTSGNGKSALAVQIGNSIASGIPIPGFKMEATSQTVLYFDFELSDKQFEQRYSEKFTNHFTFDEKLLRFEIDPEGDKPEKLTIEEFLINSIEKRIVKYNAKILIVDNITYLSCDSEKAKEALPLMKKLKELKKKYDLSILGLTHTPKRDESKPITKNDLFGSSMIYNFCDSCFSIGKSTSDESLRYIKQIKERFTSKIFDADNVIVLQIEKPGNCLQLNHIGFGKEADYLKHISENEKQVIKEMCQQRHRENKSYREIAREFNISLCKVQRFIKPKDEKLPF